MNIVIEHNGKKRRIKGPLNICGSRKDLLKIKEALSVDEDFTYGWMMISEDNEHTRTITAPTPNQKPKKF